MTLYLRFSDDGEHIRQWSREPFEGGTAYVVASDDGWQPIETAPHACHFIAAYFDDCEWAYQIVMRPFAGPFTHWRPLPAPPPTEIPMSEQQQPYVSERARMIERVLLQAVTYSDDAQRVPALQYISNRADQIAKAIEAALSLTPPASPTTGEPEHPLSSERLAIAGVGHAPGAASRDGSGTPAPDDLLSRLEGLMEKATKGPWRVEAQRLTGEPRYAAEAEARNNAIWAGPRNHFLPVVGLCSLRPAKEGEPWVPMCAISADDADLIVEAVNALPTLISRIQGSEGIRRQALEEAARVCERIKAERDAYERRCGGWDDPSVESPRSWHNPAATELEKAATAIRSLPEQEPKR